MMKKYCGVDYGSKLAGTTVVCYKEAGTLRFLQSEKKKDADLMLINFLKTHKFNQVFFDAPLSLPKAYFGNDDDFFYRKGDRILGAMSPMFLGGLTARAIKLKTAFNKDGIAFFEAYPGGLAKELDLPNNEYKKEAAFIVPLTNMLVESYQLKLKVFPANWHQFDSLLAYLIGLRYHAGNANFFGEESEGGIWV